MNASPPSLLSVVIPAHLSVISSAEELDAYATRAGCGDVKIHRFGEGWGAVTGRRP